MTRTVMPKSGGSYTRDADGKLTKVQATKPPKRPQAKPTPKSNAGKNGGSK